MCLILILTERCLISSEMDVLVHVCSCTLTLDRVKYISKCFLNIIVSILYSVVDITRNACFSPLVDEHVIHSSTALKNLP